MRGEASALGRMGLKHEMGLLRDRISTPETTPWKDVGPEMMQKGKGQEVFQCKTPVLGSGRTRGHL